MRRTLVLLSLSLLLVSTAAAARPEESSRPIPLSRYLEYARASADWTWDHYESLEEKWKSSIDPENVFGYRAPSRFLEMAAIYAFLYEREGRPVYAERARKVLLTYESYRAFYPKEAAARRADYENGVPALPDFFSTMRYLRVYDTLKRLDCLSDAEQAAVNEVVAGSVEYTLRTQEWGAMNRAALRAETLAWAVRAAGDLPAAARWKVCEQSLGFDNWGTWEIEDATIYHAVWLYALLGYADAKGEMKELFRTPEMYYYAQYFLQLICPDRMIPDFGDANWRQNWQRYLVFFEAAAAAYGDPGMKWAATVIAERFLDLEKATDANMGYMLLDCFRYGTDAVKPAQPTELSCEVMEDMVGKKIVFRNGWDLDSTYLLLNYRDEGDGGLIFRDYLRDTIAVEEEKMTHGHADENGIVLLMKDGSVLLHDGGYRDYMPSGPYGAYRQDYFHNRLCVRQEKIWIGQKEGERRYANKGKAVPGQTVLDFLHNAGSYRPVQTRKVDFLTFPDFDYSRTRLIDLNLGYEWDRIIVYVKDPELFVVFDIMKTRIAEYFTACNLWHTRRIVSQGEHWYDTAYDAISRTTTPMNAHLLITFPSNRFRLEGVEKERRHYQDELVIHRTAAQHFEIGQNVAFVTILRPHRADQDPAQWENSVECIETEPEGDGIAVRIREGNRTLLVGAKRDLRKEMTRDWRRPRYTWESGRIRYGAMESNCDFFYAEQQGKKLSYTAVNLTRAVYEGQVLFDQLEGTFGLAFDGSPDSGGIGKARYSRAERELE